jgi:hypothetical protein
MVTDIHLSSEFCDPLKLVGWRDSVTFRDPASSRLTINRHRNVALKQPLAVFAPEYTLEVSDPYSSVMKKARPKGLTYFMAGMEGFGHR